MSERIHHDPPLMVWVIPSDDDDLAPLPALLHSETEHEIIVSELDRRSGKFLLFERERRATAYRTFIECRDAMLGEHEEALTKARDEYRNQAAIVSHLSNMVPVAFPEDKAEEFLSPAAVHEASYPSVPEPAPEPPAPTRRPSRRRR